ncbi:hypothetical protein EPN16_07880 [bacterium]|nr:MAG: hypothetical protein EPN16_07880 [bacterium]
MDAQSIKKMGYNILFFVVLSAIFIHGCAFGFSEKKAKNMLKDVVNKITEANAGMSINDTKWIQVQNIPGVDEAVICQAYIRPEELEKRLQALQISSTVINSIQTTASVQDGVYLFLLRKGKIVAEGPLGGKVNLSEPVLAAKLQDSLSIEIIRLDQKWRPLQIRNIK